MIDFDDDIPVKPTMELARALLTQAENSHAEPSQQATPTPTKAVTIRVYHTRTEFITYPNGQVWIGKNQAWFEGQTYERKPKEKKTAKIAEVTTQPEETY